MEEDNERLRSELQDLRALAQYRDKKKSKYKAEALEARAQVEALQKENKSLKEEIGELIFGAGASKGKGKAGKTVPVKKK